MKQSALKSSHTSRENKRMLSNHHPKSVRFADRAKDITECTEIRYVQKTTKDVPYDKYDISYHPLFSDEDIAHLGHTAHERDIYQKAKFIKDALEEATRYFSPQEQHKLHLRFSCALKGRVPRLKELKKFFKNEPERDIIDFSELLKKDYLIEGNQSQGDFLDHFHRVLSEGNIFKDHKPSTTTDATIEFFHDLVSTRKPIVELLNHHYHQKPKDTDAAKQYRKLHVETYRRNNPPQIPKIQPHIHATAVNNESLAHNEYVAVPAVIEDALHRTVLTFLRDPRGLKRFLGGTSAVMERYKSSDDFKRGINELIKDELDIPHNKAPFTERKERRRKLIEVIFIDNYKHIMRYGSEADRKRLQTLPPLEKNTILSYFKHMPYHMAQQYIQQKSEMSPSHISSRIKKGH